MPSTGVRSVCPTCRQVGVTAVGDGACARCGTRVLLVSSKWRAPRRSNDRAWRAVAAGNVLWDARAVRRAAIRRTATVTAHQQRRRAVRQARARAELVVPAPSGHGPIHWHPGPGHPHQCPTCVVARDVFRVLFAELMGAAA